MMLGRGKERCGNWGLDHKEVTVQTGTSKEEITD